MRDRDAWRACVRCLPTRASIYLSIFGIRACGAVGLLRSLWKPVDLILCHGTSVYYLRLSLSPSVLCFAVMDAVSSDVQRGSPANDALPLVDLKMI